MTLTKLTRWSLCATIMATGVGVAVGAAGTRTVQADMAQAVCAWKASGNATSAVYHAASAVDKNGKVYIFGGLNQNGKVQQSSQVVDMGATDGTTLAGTKNSTVKPMPQKVWGAAAAYRPSSDATKVGKIYVIGGSNDDLEYATFMGTGTPPATVVIDGNNTVYEYDIDTNAWTTVQGTGALGNRLFPAATYSPGNDAVLITGGMKDCDFKGAVVGNKACQPDTLAGMWMNFDAATNMVKDFANEVGGPQKIYGHSSVYDPTHMSILIYGGTTSGSNAVNKAWRWDNSGAAPVWRALPDGMKALAFHTAAYSTAMNTMVVNGGVGSDFFKASEAFASITYGLDLTDPMAGKWSDLKALGLNPKERIGGVANFVSNGTGLMNVVMSTGRGKLPSSLTASPAVGNDNDVLSCGVAPTAGPTTPTTPTNTPGGTRTATPPGGTRTVTPVTPTAVVTVAPGAACLGLEAKAPAAAINAALANETMIGGYGMACNPNVPTNPVSNPIRHNLSLRNVNLPYHPVYNGFVWKCGCP